MKRIRFHFGATVLLAAAVPIAGCGVAETGAAAAAGASAELEQARQARQTEARVRQQLDAAYQQSAERLKAADAASQ